MKRLTLTLTILSVLCGLAQAGPEQYSGKEMKQVAPVPPSCPNWTGFYIGGFGGYKYGVMDPDLDLGGEWANEPLERDALESFGSKDLSTSGAEAGGVIGYNYQWHNWVFGAEAAGGYLWLRNSNSEQLGGEDLPFVISDSFKTHYLFTVGPRIGYAFCRWLPYVTGGMALGDLDFHEHIRLNGEAMADGAGGGGGQPPPEESFQQGGGKSETNVGWFVGGGLEYALTNHWKLRGQYQFIDLGSIDSNHDFAGFTSHHEVDLREHNASFAILYSF
jgi:outer membrane immunogenic protein